MAMDQWEAMNFALDRIFAPIEQAPRKKPLQPRYSDLDSQDQRNAIGAYWAANTHERGLIGEALYEHKLAEQIRAAFLSGDTAEFGRLADIAVREYVTDVMDIEGFRQ